MSTSIQNRSLALVVSGVVLAAFTTSAHATPVVYNSIPDNYMVSQPIYMSINNGENYVGTNANFPENPDMADGDINSTVNGEFSSVGRMQQLSLTAAYGLDSNGNPMVGSYYQPTATDQNNAFVQGTFGLIQDIRIWGPSTSSYQFNPATEVSIYYSTQTHLEDNDGGWWGNPGGINSSSITGVGQYNDVATILGVSGGSVVNAGDANNPEAIALTQSNYTVDSADSREYVDITVDIPAGATSLLFGFGINDTYTDGTGITDIQASPDLVPEPATLSLMGVAGLGLLFRRRRA